MSLKGKDILHVRDFTREDFEQVFEVADGFVSLWKEKGYKKLLEGKVLATLFFEPSTRTKFGFEAAMLKLGGTYVGWAGISYTSYEKGERFTDGIRMIDGMADIIAIRHSEVGAAQRAAEVAEAPVINCGDGTNQHPTQPFVELYTIKKLKGKIDGLNIALMGDLRGMRVVNSLVYGCAMFNAHLILVSPKELTLSEDITKELKEKYNVRITLMRPEEAVAEADMLYLSPMEIARFEDEEEYYRLRGTYGVNLDFLKRAGAKEDLIILHPLPRQEELSPDIDDTPYCGYWEMYRSYAIPIRMALLAMILGTVK